MTSKRLAHLDANVFVPTLGVIGRL